MKAASEKVEVHGPSFGPKPMSFHHLMIQRNPSSAGPSARRPSFSSSHVSCVQFQIRLARSLARSLAQSGGKKTIQIYISRLAARLNLGRSLCAAACLFERNAADPALPRNELASTSRPCVTRSPLSCCRGMRRCALASVFLGHATKIRFALQVASTRWSWDRRIFV